MIGYHLGALYLALYALDDPAGVTPTPVVLCVEAVHPIDLVDPGGACDLLFTDLAIESDDPITDKPVLPPTVPPPTVPGGACAAPPPLAADDAGASCARVLPPAAIEDD